MKKSKQGISRRDFIKGAAAGAAGLATMSLLGACSSDPAAASPEETSSLATTEAASTKALEESSSAESVPVTSDGKLGWAGTEPDIAESDVESEITADVVIVGAGLAGVCATRAAVEEGASVIVFEKASEPQSRSGDYAIINGDVQARWGRDVMDPDIITDQLMKECTYRIKRPIISRWARECGDVFSWFISAKEDFYIADETLSLIPKENQSSYLLPAMYPLPEAYDYTKEAFPTYPTTVEFLPDQKPVVNANMDKAMADGEVTLLCGHFGEKLIKEKGRITGVYARNAETGKYVKATAAKGVILTTGDYGNNKEIIQYYCPEVIENNVQSFWTSIDVEGNMTNTGDGMKMGYWAGAKIPQSHAPMIHHMGGVLGISPFLLLNVDGKRFMNEDVPGQQLENQIELLKDQMAYQIFDAEWVNQLKYMPAGHGIACYYEEDIPDQGGTYYNYKNQSHIDKALDAETLIKADTLEELFELLGLDSETALASVARYNELARNGKDEDFAKPASRMFALENPPYYAATFTVSAMLVCLGGLESDEECHTYDEDRNVLPGLYVAGNVQGNRFAVEYPICVKGVSHSMAMFYGYVAGQNCANEV